MQWGIINGNDPFLYGEKVKAYLIRGARHLPGYDIWPNERVGYGSLCVIGKPSFGEWERGLTVIDLFRIHIVVCQPVKSHFFP